MTLHRVDPRFALAHSVNRAVVLGDLDDWRTGLVSAGIEVLDAPSDRTPPDVVVSSARLAAGAREIGARSIIVEGARERTFHGSDYRAHRLLLRPTRERPTLALPLDQPAPVAYALERWSVVDRRWKAIRKRGARALVSRGLFPSWASPMVTVASRAQGPPSLVTAAGDLGVPRDVSWFLTFGQGDSLSRNAFQLFRTGSEQPEWVLKFARVAGYSERFDNDARGLEVARAAGDAIARHVPQLVGRFELDGLPASLETAAAGRRLRDLLLTPGDRAGKLALIERIADWILQLGRITRTPPHALDAELERLRTRVVPRWLDDGASVALVDELPSLSAVTQHNDLGTWNVVAGDDGRFVVVDWENVREASLPLWDLIYFLGDALVLLDGSGSTSELPRRLALLFAGESRSSPVLFAWIRRAADEAQVPYDAVGRIATLCWLSHSLSVGDHNADLVTWTPRDPPRAHGIEDVAREWLANPVLGQDWNVWRG